MSDIVIKAEGLGKKYTIGHLAQRGKRSRYITLRDVLAQTARNTWHKTRDLLQGKPIIQGDSLEEVWALKDVDFEIRRGEAVGIIGRNGAGKSTLLKILSRITEPSAGRVTIRGRVASLLEVGTGFHPELTGRENVFLNGAILGMTQREIRRKFDEIVAFAEVEKFLDTPVKRYSSGMYVRLAFAVAAHLEPEILVVDEVLAVGDAAFQNKCLGKMGEVAGAGRTVLFVSHNMGAISQLCQSSALLSGGRLAHRGDVQLGIRAYLASDSRVGRSIDMSRFWGTLVDTIEFLSLKICGLSEDKDHVISPHTEMVFALVGKCRTTVPRFRVTFSIFRDGIRLLSLHDTTAPQDLATGEFESVFRLPPLLLRPGEYSIAVGGYRDGVSEWIWGVDIARFTILEEWNERYDRANFGLINLDYTGTRKQF